MHNPAGNRRESLLVGRSGPDSGIRGWGRDEGGVPERSERF
jgi:hypothetical protein